MCVHEYVTILYIYIFIYTCARGQDDVSFTNALILHITMSF